MKCKSFFHHAFKLIGSHKVPVHGSYYIGMPKEPTGTVIYNDYKCSICGQHYSEEKLYSYRDN